MKKYVDDSLKVSITVFYMYFMCKHLYTSVKRRYFKRRKQPKHLFKEICIKTALSVVFTGGVWQTGGGGVGEKKEKMGGGGETGMLLEVQSCLVIHWLFDTFLTHLFIYLFRRPEVDNTHTKIHFNATQIEDRSHIVFILSVSSSFYLSETLNLWWHILSPLSILSSATSYAGTCYTYCRPKAYIVADDNKCRYRCFFLRLIGRQYVQ